MARELTSVRSAQLHGRDVEAIGAIESVAEGPAAIALSRGGSAKRYEHVDRNEDACSFTIGPGGVLIVAPCPMGRGSFSYEPPKWARSNRSMTPATAGSLMTPAARNCATSSTWEVAPATPEPMDALTSNPADMSLLK